MDWLIGLVEVFFAIGLGLSLYLSVLALLDWWEQRRR